MCSTFKNNAILIFAMIFILNERDQKKVNKKYQSTVDITNSQVLYRIRVIYNKAVKL